MSMDKGFVGFMLVFLLLALSGIALGHWNSIPATVAAADVKGATGPWEALALNKVLSIIVRFLFTAVFSGIMLLVFTEGKKAYSLWKKDSMTRRWKPGPNANWKPPQQTGSRLTKNDLMFMSLLGQVPPRLKQQQFTRQTNEQDDGNDLDIDLS